MSSFLEGVKRQQFINSRNFSFMFSKEVTESPAYKWFDERLEVQAISDDISSKYVPPHVNIFYCLGGITLVCFLIQFATGFAMTFYYKPTVTEAFASVQYIMTEVNFGWLIRSIHRWSASMMVLMMILHIFRVYLTGGFKKPRELTWVTGVVMAVITVSFGVTGYSLPWDQIGYWAVKIVSGVPDAIPVVGSTIVELNAGRTGCRPRYPKLVFIACTPSFCLGLSQCSCCCTS
jgi:cytochrome b6